MKEFADALKASAKDVFDWVNCPQDVRDVIEWCASFAAEWPSSPENPANYPAPKGSETMVQITGNDDALCFTDAHGRVLPVHDEKGHVTVGGVLGRPNLPVGTTPASQANLILKRDGYLVGGGMQDVNKIDTSPAALRMLADIWSRDCKVLAETLRAVADEKEKQGVLPREYSNEWLPSKAMESQAVPNLLAPNRSDES